jgi:hypothetical protein
MINPSVPWWFAVPCNALAGSAVVLLFLDYFNIAMALLVLAALTLYG